MTHYTPWLISLAYARQHRRLGTPTQNTDDDTLIGELIQEASAEFITALQRIPMPYVDTKSFDASHVYGYELRLRDDLLAATTLTNGDSSTISGSLYALRPDNHYPKSRVELSTIGGTYWSLSYPEDRVQIAGTWGYVPHYNNGAWKSITTLAEEVDTSETAIDLTSAASLSVGDYLKVDSEVVGYISAISSNTVTVDSRAALGTTAATHSNGATVYAYQQLSDIKGAVRELVVWYYLHKDQVGGRVQVLADGFVQVQDLDARVQKTLNAHKRKLLPMAV